MPGKTLKLNAIGWGIALSLALSTTSSWAALPHQLQGVQLDSNEVETRILLEAHDQIPYSLVNSSEDKIVIDLLVANPNQPIKTDFAQSENIDHVVLKPLSGQKLRLIIRGDHLGQPIVGLARAAGSRSSIASRPAMSNTVSKPAAVRVPDEFGGIAMSAVADEAPAKAQKQASSKPSPKANDKKAQKPAETEAATAEPINPIEAEMSLPPEGTVIDNPLADTTISDDSIDDGQSGDLFAEPEKVPERKPLADKSTADSESDSDSSPFGMLSLSDINNFATFGPLVELFKKIGTFRLMIFGGLALMWMALMKRRRPNPFQKAQFSLSHQDDGLWQDEQEGSSHGNWIGNLLNSIFQPPSRPTRTRQLMSSMTPASRPQRGGDRPVGLRGLEDNYYDQQRTPAPDIQGLTVRNTALQQYSMQSKPAMSNPRHSTDIDRELQRSLAMRGATQRSQNRTPAPPAAAKKPPAAPKQPQASTRPTKSLGAPPRKPSFPQPPMADKPAPTGRSAPPSYSQAEFPKVDPKTTPTFKNRAQAAPAQQPQPGLPANNDEVLDFLRSVADLMEKEGKPDLARGIKKGMNQK